MKRVKVAFLVLLILIGGSVAGLFTLGIGLPFIFHQKTEVYIGFNEAVEKVNSYSISLEISSYISGESISLDRDDYEFQYILLYIENSQLDNCFPKNTSYPKDFVLTFELEDGSRIQFVSSNGSLWYETWKEVCEALVSPDLNEILNQIISEI